MPPARLAAVSASLLVSAMASLHACDSGSTQGGSTFNGMLPIDQPDGPVFEAGLGYSSSSGAGSSSSSGSGGGTPYTCTGCIDLGGKCQDGTADDKCGIGNSTCVNCAGFFQVCGPLGECVDGSAGPPQADGGGPESGAEGGAPESGADGGGSEAGTDGAGATDGSPADAGAD
jgi:hypothetical protein